MSVPVFAATVLPSDLTPKWLLWTLMLVRVDADHLEAEPVAREDVRGLAGDADVGVRPREIDADVISVNGAVQLEAEPVVGQGQSVGAVGVLETGEPGVEDGHATHGERSVLRPDRDVGGWPVDRGAGMDVGAERLEVQVLVRAYARTRHDDGGLARHRFVAVEDGRIEDDRVSFRGGRRRPRSRRRRAGCSRRESPGCMS